MKKIKCVYCPQVNHVSEYAAMSETVTCGGCGRKTPTKPKTYGQGQQGQDLHRSQRAARIERGE